MKLRLAFGLLVAGASHVCAQRPSVSIATPAHGATLPSGFITLSVNASDVNGTVVRVDYYINGAIAESGTEPDSFPATIYCTPARYVVRAVAFDDEGYWTESAPSSFQVGAEYPVNLVRGSYLQSCTSTSIIVRWRTDWPTNSVVRYGSNAPGAFAVTNHVRTSEHAVSLTGLTPDTWYSYSFGSDWDSFEPVGGTVFRTAPTNTRPVNVWVIGDFGTTGEEQAAVRDSFLDYGNPDATDLWLMLGDNAYESGTDDEYQAAVFNIYDTILPNKPVWPTIGNHDAALPDAAGRFAYLDIFDLPVNGEAGGVASGTERYYSFDYANVHFVSLDSQTSDRATNGAMLTWLREDLAATERDWIVAYWHHPPYSSGTHFSDTEREMVEMRERALPILEAHGADLVLTGHSHVYERSYLINGHYGKTNTFQAAMKIDGSLGRDDDGGPYRKPAGGLGANRGTVYAVCGCSGQGGAGHPFFYGQQPSMVRSLGGFGSMLLQFDRLRLDVKFLRPDGTFDDYFSIDKSDPGLVRPRLNLVRSAAGVELSWPTSVPRYVLESAPAALANGGWQEATNLVARAGRRNKVSVSAAGSNQFFRLRTEP